MWCIYWAGGGTFDFNLEEGKGMDKPNQSHIDSTYITTLGLLYNLGGSLAAAAISSIGAIHFATVLHAESAVPEKTTNSIEFIEHFWVSGTIPFVENGENTVDGHIDWSSIQSDGACYIWSVPYVKSHADADPVRRVVAPSVLKEIMIIGPVLILHHYNAEGSKIFLGSNPAICDRFLIYTEQRSQKLFRDTSLHRTEDRASRNINLYGITDCVVGAPSFTPTILSRLSHNAIASDVRNFRPYKAYTHTPDFFFLTRNSQFFFFLTTALD
jgi:hypothetical protein